MKTLNLKQNASSVCAGFLLIAAVITLSTLSSQAQSTQTKVTTVVVAEPENQSAKANGEGNEIYTAVEHSAQFPGGIKKFYEYLANNIKYPADARKNNVQGKVFLTFVVEKDGSLSDIKVMRGIGSGCDEEALRVIKASPKWVPGTQNGRTVRQQYTAPIGFSLSKTAVK